MIRGYDITIHTDHLNLLYKKLPNQRILRWRLLLEDFNLTVEHIAGDFFFDRCTIKKRNEEQIS